MILVTTENVSGYKAQTLGIVQGNMVQTKNFGHDLGASLKTLVGGELKAYTDMMNEARDEATKRMTDQAAGMGADAIVCVRYASSAIMQGAAEVIAYGTAVKLVQE